MGSLSPRYTRNLRRDTFWPVTFGSIFPPSRSAPVLPPWRPACIVYPLAVRQTPLIDSFKGFDRLLLPLSMNSVDKFGRAVSGIEIVCRGAKQDVLERSSYLQALGKGAYFYSPISPELN